MEENFENWKIKSSEEAKEASKHDGEFIRAKVKSFTYEKVTQTCGWISEIRCGNIFIPFDSDEPEDIETHWYDIVEYL